MDTAHITPPETIRFAKEQGVIIFCLPPHTTHEAQPLDVSFFKALKSHWRDTCHNFYQESPGKAITKFNFMELFSKAWMLTVTPTNITAGFRKAGIVPFNPDAIIPLDAVESNEEVSSPAEAIDKENSANIANPPVFSAEKLELFNKRYEEGYDLEDSEYSRWLEAYHPDEHFGAPLSPVFGTASPHSNGDSPRWSPPSTPCTARPQVSSTPCRIRLFAHEQQHSGSFQPNLPFNSSWSSCQLQTTPPNQFHSPLGFSSWPSSLPPTGRTPSLHLNSSWSYHQQQVHPSHHLDCSSWSTPEQQQLTHGPISPPVSSKEILSIVAILIQWNLQIKDTLGPAILSSIERLSSSWRLKMMGKGSRSVSFVGRLSLSRRVLYWRFHCIGHPV